MKTKLSSISMHIQLKCKDEQEAFEMFNYLNNSLDDYLKVRGTYINSKTGYILTKYENNIREIDEGEYKKSLDMNSLTNNKNITVYGKQYKLPRMHPSRPNTIIFNLNIKAHIKTSTTYEPFIDLHLSRIEFDLVKKKIMKRKITMYTELTEDGLVQSTNLYHTIKYNHRDHMYNNIPVETLMKQNNKKPIKVKLIITKIVKLNDRYIISVKRLIYKSGYKDIKPTSNRYLTALKIIDKTTSNVVNFDTIVKPVDDETIVLNPQRENNYKEATI